MSSFQLPLIECKKLTSSIKDFYSSLPDDFHEKGTIECPEIKIESVSESSLKLPLSKDMMEKIMEKTGSFPCELEAREFKISNFDSLLI